MALRTGALVAALLVGCASAPAPAPPRPAEVTVEPDLPGRAAASGGAPVSVTRLHASEHQTINLLRIEGPVPAHRHEHSDETVYLLEGRGVLETDGGSRELKAGDLVVVPRGAAHGFTPVDGPAVVLSIFSPAFVEGDRVPVTR